MVQPPFTLPVDRVGAIKELVAHGPLRLARDPCPLLPLTDAEARSELISLTRQIRILLYRRRQLIRAGATLPPSA